MVAFYFTKEQEGEFFDSYGSPPSKYSGTFTTFLKNNSNQWTFNTVTDYKASIKKSADITFCILLYIVVGI